MTSGSARPRLAADIGGTFTDVALAVDGRGVTAKVLTTPANPEEGVIAGVSKVLADAGIAAGDVVSIIHGTTLATNARLPDDLMALGLTPADLSPGRLRAT